MFDKDSTYYFSYSHGDEGWGFAGKVLEESGYNLKVEMRTGGVEIINTAHEHFHSAKIVNMETSELVDELLARMGG